jgi:hypothetical protein
MDQAISGRGVKRVALSTLVALSFVFAVHSEPSQAEVAQPISDIADAFMVENDGSWFCQSQDVKGNGAAGLPTTKWCAEPSWQAAGSLQYYFATYPSQLPNTMRVGKARNDCVQGQTGANCATGVPAPPPTGATCPIFNGYASTTPPVCILSWLKSQAVNLGDVVSASGGRDDEHHTTAREIKDMAWQACEINRDDASNLYGFVFLDLASALNDERLAETVDRIQSGQVYENGSWQSCTSRTTGASLGGFPVITNDRNYSPSAETRLRTGAWAHAKDISLLNDFDYSTPKATRDQIVGDALRGGGPLKTLDHQFLDAVHQKDPGSIPVLRFEVTSQTGKMADLKMIHQQGMLCELAKRQQSNDFRLIYPLFVHGLDEVHGDTNPASNDIHPPYDSLAASTATLSLQGSLVIAYPSAASPPPACPAN